MANPIETPQNEMVSKKLKMGSLLDVGLDLGFAVFDYKSYKADGDSTAAALAKTGGQLALDVLLPWQVQIPMQLMMAAPSLYTAMKGMGQHSQSVVSQSYLGAFGGNFSLNTQAAATMREAGVRAIQNNNMNLRSVLGSEARTYRR